MPTGEPPNYTLDYVRERINRRTSEILWDWIRYIEGELDVNPLHPSTRFILKHYVDMKKADQMNRKEEHGYL